MRRERRFLSVICAVESAREAHPELVLPLNWSRLQRVLAREEIDVIRRPIQARAYVQGNDGSFVITVSSGLHGRHYSRVIAHEYAHIRLHLTDRGEVARDLTPCQRGDPREYEAELFALLLRIGPTATPDHPEVARLVAKMEAPRFIERMPEQTSLELPERPPVFDRPARSDDARAHERRLIRQGAARVTATRTSWLSGPIITDRMTDDDARIKFYDEATGAARFTDRRGVRWWIYNYRVIAGPAGERRRERIADFMSLEVTHRLFVNAAGDQRVYQFANRRERRAYRAAHLDRQLAHARALAEKRSLARALLTRLRRSKP